MAKSWKKQDLTYLKRYSEKRTVAELSERFGIGEAAVRRKLAELGLQSKDGALPPPVQEDPMVKVYERGLKAVDKSKWAEAAKLFSRVASETDQPDLAERARRYIAICRKQRSADSVPADEDPFLRAVYERNRGNFEEALALCSRGGRQGKDDRFAYLAASIFALTGDRDKAAKQLERAIELNPKNRIHAHHDADFDELREDSEFRDLFQ